MDGFNFFQVWLPRVFLDLDSAVFDRNWSVTFFLGLDWFYSGLDWVFQWFGWFFSDLDFAYLNKLLQFVDCNTKMGSNLLLMNSIRWLARLFRPTDQKPRLTRFHEGHLGAASGPSGGGFPSRQVSSLSCGHLPGNECPRFAVVTCWESASLRSPAGE
jgi:hypothetical protein